MEAQIILTDNPVLFFNHEVLSVLPFTKGPAQLTEAFVEIAVGTSYDEKYRQAEHYDPYGPAALKATKAVRTISNDILKAQALGLAWKWYGPSGRLAQWSAHYAPDLSGKMIRLNANNYATLAGRNVGGKFGVSLAQERLGTVMSAGNYLKKAPKSGAWIGAAFAGIDWVYDILHAYANGREISASEHAHHGVKVLGGAVGGYVTLAVAGTLTAGGTVAAAVGGLPVIVLMAIPLGLGFLSERLVSLGGGAIIGHFGNPAAPSYSRNSEIGTSTVNCHANENSKYVPPLITPQSESSEKPTSSWCEVPAQGDMSEACANHHRQPRAAHPVHSIPADVLNQFLREAFRDKASYDHSSMVRKLAGSIR